MTEAEQVMSPAARMAKGLCPECAMPLAGLSVAVHSATHWDPFIKPDGQNDEAITRQRMLKDFAKNQETD